MKKTMVLFVVLSIVLSGSLMADGLGYGVKGGLNMAKKVGEDAEYDGISPKFKCGLTIGGFVLYPINNKITLRPEVLITQKGARYKGDTSDGYDYKEKVKMTWLDIPVLAVYQVADGITAFAGPYIDLFLGGEYEWEWEGDGMSFDGDEKIEGEDVNSLGFGLIFGGAYGVRDNIDVEARIALGLTSIDEDHTIRNFGFQVIANYYLKRNK
jgi:hypothetical protein